MRRQEGVLLFFFCLHFRVAKMTLSQTLQAPETIQIKKKLIKIDLASEMFLHYYSL